MWDLVGNPEDRFSHNEAQLMFGSHNHGSPTPSMRHHRKLKHYDGTTKRAHGCKPVLKKATSEAVQRPGGVEGVPVPLK